MRSFSNDFYSVIFFWELFRISPQQQGRDVSEAPHKVAGRSRSSAARSDAGALQLEERGTGTGGLGFCLC